MGTILLILLILGVLYVASLYLWPYRPCSKCHGSGRNAGSNKRRYGDCPKCSGAGRARRFGARRVHNAALGISKRFRGGMRR